MMDAAAVRRIAGAVKALGRDLDALEQAGRGIPTVEKNAARMRGSLRQLDVQFVDLDAVSVAGNP